MNKLRELVISLRFSVNVLQDDTDLINDLGYDSLQIIRLLAEIENEYDIKIPYDTINYEIFNNYKKLESYVNGRIELAKG